MADLVPVAGCRFVSPAPQPVGQGRLPALKGLIRVVGAGCARVGCGLSRRATRMAAIAQDVGVVRCAFAERTAELTVFRRRAHTRRMRTFFRFVISHCFGLRYSQSVRCAIVFHRTYKGLPHSPLR
jgi:hypothetical protein